MKILALVILAGQLSFGGSFGAWPSVAPIAFPASDRAQFVRITLEPAADTAPGVRIVDDQAAETAYVVDPDAHRAAGTARPPSPAPVDRIAAPVLLPAETGSPDQVWLFDLGQPSTSVGVRFAGAPAGFDATGSVESSPDGKLWSPVVSGAFARSALGDASAPFTEIVARYWRVTLKGSARAPVPGLVPKLLVQPHDLLFEALPGRTYAVLVGNTAAPGPTYDLAARLEREQWTDVRGTVGTFAPNESFEGNLPIFERYPWLLETAAGLLVLAAGLFILLSRRPRESEDEGAA